MSAALHPRLPATLAELLDWERGQSLRYEWDGVQSVAMVGGSFARTEIASRLTMRCVPRFVAAPAPWFGQTSRS